MPNHKASNQILPLPRAMKNPHILGIGVHYAIEDQIITIQKKMHTRQDIKAWLALERAARAAHIYHKLLC